MTQAFNPGDKVKYKEAERYAAKGNMHDADKVYTVAQSSREYVTFEESPYFCCTYRLEKVEENMKKHKHCDLIKKWADGACIQYRSEEGIWYDVFDNNPSWNASIEFRVKPANVKKWKWVYKDQYGRIRVTNRFWTKEDFNRTYPLFTLVQKIDSEMIEE